MGIVSTREEQAASPTPQFPCLMLGRNSEQIVLFKAPKCGTVVSSGCYTANEGRYSTDWLMEVFEPFNGTLTLENS